MAVNLDTNSMLSSWLTQTGSVASTTASSLQHTLGNISGETEDAELLEACKSFESYLVEQVFKAMEKTVGDDEEDENEYLSCFGDTLIQEYAKATTERGSLGLAQKLYESMKNNS